MNAFGYLNLPELQKKWKNNPQLAVGASALVGVFGIAYLMKRLGSSKDDESHIPDFALPNDDREMTERLTNIRNRREARKQKKQKNRRNKQRKYKKEEKLNENNNNNNNTDNKNNNNLDGKKKNSNLTNENDITDENDDGKNMNVNDNNDNNDNIDNDNENENGFNADEYYNPRLKIRRESLQRKPDAYVPWLNLTIVIFVFVVLCCV